MPFGVRGRGVQDGIVMVGVSGGMACRMVFVMVVVSGWHHFDAVHFQRSGL